jgi:protein ImuA
MSVALGKEPDHPAALPRGFPLAGGALHEFYAPAEADGVSLSALAMLLGLKDGKRATLWVRHEALAGEAGTPYPAGLAELGVDPARLLLVRARDVPSALQAGLEGARCAALGAVTVEFRGEARAYDLTASRRLALAAKASGVPVFLLRIGAKAVPSAAETRWLARAAPSRALAAKAPGPPAFHLTLLRARNGQEGEQHHLEWNRDAQRFENRFMDREPGTRPAAGPAAPLPRFVVPLSFDRPRPADDEPFRHAG